MIGSIACLGSGAAIAQTGGSAPPGGTPAPPTTPTTPTTPAPTTTATAAFPILGPHTYGQGFGAARAGRGHQGVDLMSPCGTPLVAVTNGRIKFRKFQGSAGNYVVLRANQPVKQDYFYAHLATPSPLLKGQKVTTGQQLGVVGRTGNASACHLHFELWVAPGWYRGGHPVNPLTTLQTWDALS